MTRILNKPSILSILMLFFTLGCQSVPNDATDTQTNEARPSTEVRYNEKDDRKAATVRGRKWQLIQMDGFDAQQSTYQRFTLSFNDTLLSAKAFNTFTLPIAEMADNGVLSFAGVGMSTRVGVFEPEKATLEQAYFNRVKSAKLWRVLRRQLVIGSGKNKLVFIRAE